MSPPRMNLPEARKLAKEIIHAATTEVGEGVDLDDVMDLCEWVLEPKRKKRSSAQGS